MSSSALEVAAWVSITDGCAFAYKIQCPDVVEIKCGNTDEGFDFHIEPEALRDLIKVGTKALMELDGNVDTMSLGCDARR
jgi:hypothetical protein